MAVRLRLLLLGIPLLACIGHGLAAAQPAGPSLTLEQAVAAARAHSGARAAADARVEGATLGAAAAGRWLNPFTEVRSENWGAGAEGLATDTFLVLTQSIELGGKRAARREVANAALDEARAGAALAGVDADLAVIRRYLAAFGARTEARALAQQEDEVGELVRVLARRAEAGTVPEADLRKLEVEHARIGLDRLAAELVGTRALAELAAWLGPEAPASLDALVEPSLPALPARPVPDSHLEERPDVRAARARAAAAAGAARVERARAVPDLAVSGGLKRTGRHDGGVVALSLPVLIFDRNRAAVARAEGEHRAAELDVAFALRRATAEAHAARDVAGRLLAEVRTIDARLVAPARVARDAARAAFREGLGSLLPLVDAERTHGDAELLALRLWQQARIATFEARAALGEALLP
jgi:outer membrane protein, heavy metal efflux system